MAGTTEGGKKSSKGGRGNPEKASPAAIEKYLKGIGFPADKKKLIKHAQENKAPEDVIHVLNKNLRKKIITALLMYQKN